MRAVFFLLIGMGTIGLNNLGAGGTKSDSEVKVTAKAGKIDSEGKQTVTIQFVINDGWHIYANPVGNEDLLSAQTQVTITSKAKLKAVKIYYPKGTLNKDKLAGDYKIYEGKPAIQADVLRAAGDTGPLEVSIRFMACHKKGICLLPATVKLSVP